MTTEMAEQATSLKTEIEAALQAIAQNSIEELEASLWKQHLLCDRLNQLLSLMLVAEPTQHTITLDSEALHNLHRSTVAYDGAVQQLGATTNLLYRLCLTYRTETTHGVSQSPYINEREA